MPRQLAFMLAFLVGGPALGLAAEPAVSFPQDGQSLSLTTTELLARPDATRIVVPNDVSYGTTMHYRAVPVRDLLLEAKLSLDEPVEVKALDGFIAQFPAGVFKGTAPDDARAFLAVEPPDAPWPKLKGKDASAGPFYVVWLNPARGRIGNELWPYQVASFENALAPLRRWPQLDLPRTLPAHGPPRRGLTGFIENCLPCHKMNGGGESTVGPDLNLPMNPTEYFQPAALRAFIRDPDSVRVWPERQMTGFDREALSEEDLDDLIAYLAAIAQRRP